MDGRKEMSFETGSIPKRKLVRTLEDLSLTECWVIVKDGAVHHEGDERSRTHPGHGYPEYTERFVQIYELFENEQLFKDALASQVKEQRFGSPSVRGFKLIPYTTKTIVEVIPT